MRTLPYATEDEYRAYPWTPDPPPLGLAARLAEASDDMDDVLLTARYPVGDDGRPTDPDHAEALRAATCQQVRYLAGAGTDGTGADDRWDSVKIGSVAMSGRRPAAGGARADGLDVAPRAVRTLRRAGLLPGAVSGR